MCATCLATVIISFAIVLLGDGAERPKVLFYTDPQKSDNEIVRRRSPEVLSVAEQQFVEMTHDLFDVTATQDSAEVARERLKEYRAVVFFTAINPPADKQALVEWVRDGGAFVGIHSTANTYQNYAPFGEMLGANYDSRPWRTKDQPLVTARIRVEDRVHPATMHLGDSFEIEDDLYLFKNWDRSNVNLLLSLDPTSLDLMKVTPRNREMPVAWTKSYGKGRVFYTALGDAEHVWKDARYRTHLIKGVMWTMER